ncbi:MAG: cytochrome c [Pseudomonadales bacterium]|nr:cytochrome c [Pseudomonadales bacterium]MCP5213911.1 cytochrome c [Pseudomonadales bacterium]MCP5302879.1 cytochrome c [Pseudomonadales bacterium]
MPKRYTCFVVMGVMVLLAACQSHSLKTGQTLFQENCANCHGIYAEGDGPASVDIGLPIPDLRYLRQSSAGIFPADLVYQVIDGQRDDVTHFPRRMPVWGYEFSVREGDDDSAVRHAKEKIQALTDYIQSIQQPE